MSKRKDKCYYCTSTQDLGVETTTGHVQCVNCVVGDEARRREERHRIYRLTGKRDEYK